MLALVCLVVAGWLLPAWPAHATAPVRRVASPAAGRGVAAAVAPGRWVAPLAGPLAVRRRFDPPPVRWGAGHRGVDLAAYPGALVRAAGAGRVGYAGVLAGRGVLTVGHGALRTTYEPVRPLVPAGRPVAAGEVVAVLAAGHAGPARPGEALLHWGLLRGATYLDPLSLLRRGPSRLVPVPPAGPAPPPAAPLVAPPHAERPRPVLGPPGSPAPLRPAALPPAPLPPGRGRAPGLAEVTAVGVGGAGLAALGLSRAGRRACRAAGARPSCASGRSGSRSRPGPGRSPPA